MSALALRLRGGLQRSQRPSSSSALALKIRGYLRTPAPLKIPTTPAPTTGGGVALRLGREVVFFESLFKSSKWTWIFGWTFHAALLLVLLRHLRYFQQPVWAPVALIPAFRHLRRVRHGRGAGGPVGATVAGRPRALRLDAVRSPASGAIAGDRPHRGWAALRAPHRHRCRSRPSCSASCGSTAAAAGRPGRCWCTWRLLRC